MSLGYASQDGAFADENALFPFFMRFICIPVVYFGLKDRQCLVCWQLRLRLGAERDELGMGPGTRAGCPRQTPKLIPFAGLLPKPPLTFR